jgi:hypothetical protein
VQIKVLKPSECPDLTGTEMETILPLLSDSAKVILAYEGEKLLGTWSLYTMVHAEGIWIDPEHRGKAAVARALLTTLVNLVVSEFDAGVFMTASDKVSVERMVRSLGGVEVGGKHFAVAIPREGFTLSEEVA